MAIKICNNTVIDNSRRFLGAANNNIFFGDGAGACTTGSDNIFIGCLNGCRTTSGIENIFIGDVVGCRNSTGSGNIFLGSGSGGYNTVASNNVFIGSRSGRFNTTGECNVFIGNDTGFGNDSGRWNSFFGASAGVCNTTGGCNTYIGLESGSRNNGSENVAIGTRSGLGIYSGLTPTPAVGTAIRNVSIGHDSGYASYGSCNVFLGYRTGYCGCSALTGAGSNTFLGYYAGRNNLTGANNLYAGSSAGLLNTGNANVFLGFRSGESSTNSCLNVLVGARSGFSITTGQNNIAIGNNSATTAFSPTGLVNLTTECHRIVMGNSSHTCAQIQVAWTAVSDVRDKCVFGSVPHGRGFLQNINPIEFSFKDRVTGEITDNKKRYGFSAQEVLSLEGGEPVIVSNEDPEKLFLTTDYLIPVLVNAVKELDDENKTCKLQIEELSAKVQQLETEVDSLKTV